MFCKNCGNKLEEASKFCPSCGTQVTQNEASKKEAPRQFGYQNTLQEGGGAQYQKTAFKGKQWGTEASGNVSFGSGSKKRGLFGRLIRFGIIIAVIMVVYFVFFGSGPVYDIHTGSGFDVDTYNVTNESSTFASNTPTVYVAFSTQDLEIGTTVYIKWYSLIDGNEVLEASNYITTTDEAMDAYSYVQAPSGWNVGEYEIRFEVDGEVVATKGFTIE